MPNQPLNTDLFDRAALFAINAHSGTERRGKGFPYAVHIMEACSIVSTMTNDPDLLAAALLHDVLEDTSVTDEELREQFGNRVADLVVGETDITVDAPEGQSTWKERKQFAIRRIAHQSREAKMVALGDKLSNMRAIAADFAHMGDALWDRFHAPEPSLHEWHYRGLAEALKDLSDTDAYREFVRLIEETFPKAFWNQNKS